MDIGDNRPSLKRRERVRLRPTTSLEAELDLAETILIRSLAFGGDAVGRLADGRTAFIPGGCPGDAAEIEIAEDHGRFVRTMLQRVVEPSPERVEPPCPYFGICGGCQWQHVSYAAQLEAKRTAVVDALSRIGHLEDAETLVAPAVPSAHEYGYRNKVELVAGARKAGPEPNPGSGGLTLGYHAPRSDKVVPVDTCLLLPKRLQKAPKALSGALRYLSGGTDLGVSRVSLRAARNTRDVEIALWTPTGPFPRAAGSRVLGQALSATSLTRVLYRGDPAHRDASKVEVLGGKGHWRERMSGFTFAVSAPSFFQTNTASAERLVELVLDTLAPDGTDRVLDLYAGVGTFTLPLAELASEVVAIESYRHAVRDLRRNLESNQLWAEVIGGDAAREIGEIGHFDLAVVDPPRSGLDPRVITALGAARPRTLAYVSCDPATLARDSARLAAEGMRLVHVTPVDLFPQTFHIECVARFDAA